MKLYPLKFKPIYKERIWGGRKLKEYFGKDIPEDALIGESWELCDLPDNHSEIINGSLAGKTLDKVLKDYPEQITGSGDFKPPFPLLIKLLDAEDVLSVQVHPDLETCRQMHKGEPKTECWYMIDVEDRACIYKGLKEGTTAEQFRKSIEKGSCEKLLKKVPVKQGECHFLPSGTPHAIGAGLLIAEIQQPSDTTYRVFDWNRVDKKTGEPRELHIEDALKSIHFDSSGDNLTVSDTGRLVNAEEFKVDKGHRTAGGEVLLEAGKMKVFLIIKGEGRIISNDNDIEDFSFKTGETFLIPAIFAGTFIAQKETEYLTITL